MKSRASETIPRSQPEEVSAFINELPATCAEMTAAVRDLILSASNEVGEHIKWNSPAFFFSGPMKPLDPKTYPRDLAVIHTRKGYPMLVFPTGHMIKEGAGILEGDYKDGRRMVTFRSIEEVRRNGAALQRVVRSWIDIVRGSQ